MHVVTFIRSITESLKLFIAACHSLRCLVIAHGRILLSGLLISLGLTTTPAYSDGVPNSGIADFYYNRATGAMFFDTDGQTAVSMLLEGPSATSIERFAGVDAATDTNWLQGYFANKEQWVELSLTGIQGVFKIATYPAGLIETDFSSAEYGTVGGDIEFTDVTLLDFAADFDRDGKVDQNDLFAWQVDYGVNELSDANNDGQTNGYDFLVWQREFGSGVMTPAPLQIIPEPSSVALMIVSLLSGVCKRNRISCF